jgi:arginyl-tRNA--protein-N-Asp/Glu arginylyltransferase
MFAQVHKPEVLSGEELDHYLTKGWFRNGQRIFTTNFLNFNSQLYSAIWLRIQLKALKEDKGFKKLSKLNNQFSITIQPASITPEKEALFQTYRSEMSFSASQSLQALLFGDSIRDIFNTYEVLLHDKERLIGVGYFDIGNTAAAGIVSFYDPAYKKCSLGKYLILIKVNYCKELGLDFFYPGYFAPDYPAFDYKLTIGRDQLSFLQLSSQKWLPIDSFNVLNDPYQSMMDKLKEAQQLLVQYGVSSKLYNYTFFEANIIPNLVGLNLFDFPVFLTCFEEVEDVVNPMIVYDVSNQCFHLVVCKSVWKADASVEEPGFYSSHLLKLKKHICSAREAEEVVKIILNATTENSNLEK